jgi:hypothetical protein
VLLLNKCLLLFLLLFISLSTQSGNFSIQPRTLQAIKCETCPKCFQPYSAFSFKTVPFVHVNYIFTFTCSPRFYMIERDFCRSSVGYLKVVSQHSLRVTKEKQKNSE